MGRLNELQIELTGLCNASCVHCTWRKRTRGRQHMDKALALRLLDEARDLKLDSVRYHGVGESLLYPHLLEVIARGEALGLPHSLSTNCRSLTGELAAGLRAFRSLQVILAIPWVMPNEFVDACVDNALAYIPSNNIILQVQLICHEDAQRHYDRFISLFLPLVQRHPNMRLHLKQPLTWPDAEVPSRGFVNQEHRFHPRADVDIRLTPLSIAHRCNMPERFLMITADGTAVPCCVGTEDWGLGQIGARSLGEVWASPEMKRLRKLWHKADDSIPCGRCKKRADCRQ